MSISINYIRERPVCFVRDFRAFFRKRRRLLRNIAGIG